MAENVAAEISSESYFDEELDQLIVSLTPEAEKIVPQTKENFPCTFCEKICLSKGGLTRHKRSQHLALLPPEELPAHAQTVKKSAEEILHPGTLKKLVEKCAAKLSVDECYPDDVMSTFKSFRVLLEDVMPCYEFIKPLIEKFNGDAEKFYPVFYQIFKKNRPFNALNYHCTILLGMELCNHVIVVLTGAKVNIEGQTVYESKSFFEMDKKEKSIITYLSGYVVGTFYRRIKFSKSQSNCEYAEQCLSFLSACKYQEGRETDTSHHSFVDLMDRGGLWKVSIDTIRIFSVAESFFVSSTKNFTTKIDATKIVDSLMSDSYLVSCSNKIRNNSAIVVKKEIAFNLIEEMLTLYIRVRSHSYAKDQQQKHKSEKSSLKSRSLRTERKKADPSLDSGH